MASGQGKTLGRMAHREARICVTRDHEIYFAYYHNSRKVKEILNERGRDLCLNKSCESSNDESHSDSEVSQAKRFKEERTVPVFECQLLVCESMQVSAFVDSINKTSCCSTANSYGKCICLLFWEVPLNLDPGRHARCE